jgi:hypothetical protein
MSSLLHREPLPIKKEHDPIRRGKNSMIYHVKREESITAST